MPPPLARDDPPTTLVRQDHLFPLLGDVQTHPTAHVPGIDDPLDLRVFDRAEDAFCDLVHVDRGDGE